MGQHFTVEGFQPGGAGSESAVRPLGLWQCWGLVQQKFQKYRQREVVVLTGI